MVFVSFTAIVLIAVDTIRAQFMLTEVGHGLDARNLETTATLLPDGGFELHSPSEAAAKLVKLLRNLENITLLEQGAE